MSEELDAALFGRDLFGEAAAPTPAGALAERYLIPPFTTLDTRQGEWQERRRAWLRLGIQSELGRDKSLLFKNEAQLFDYYRVKEGDRYTTKGQGTSIFDPVLCELCYRWWSPEGGQVVDPFAGGSVRGVVAGSLGRAYWGCDLSGAQIVENRKQADAIFGPTRTINVSAAMMRQPFQLCEPTYIKDVCKGRCCEGSDGITVTIHPSEVQEFRRRGALVRDSFLVADGRGLCPYKTNEGLCGRHADKPFGCKASPFTLTASDTLIVRNRYRLLRCYKTAGAVPAYRAHRWSLEQIMGAAEVDRLTQHLDAGGGDLKVTIPTRVWAMLKDNDAAKGSDIARAALPTWITGDARMCLLDAPEADFVFSCPPYGDLEQYSDDARDLSNMDAKEFMEAYRQIIGLAAMRLKPNRFACFVVGDYRDKDGHYVNFVGQTVKAFHDAGLRFYNEAILINVCGTAPVRAATVFDVGRKLVKLHQNVLVFVKGDWRKAGEAMQAKKKEAPPETVDMFGEGVAASDAGAQ